MPDQSHPDSPGVLGSSPQARSAAVPVADDGTRRRALLGSSVGTGLEWFDFLLYGALAGVVFPHVFFPTSSPASALLQSFATFGVGFLARPLGAAFFARTSDRVGRKHTMVITLTLMGFASLAIACLPGYATIGVLAPILLVALRFLQGFSVGGEASSAQVLALEYAPDDRRGFYGSLVNIGNPGSQVIVALFLLGAGSLLGDEALRTWAWRIPFLIGAVMAFVGYLIRRHLDESPAFVAAQMRGAQSKAPIREIFSKHGKVVIALAVLWAPNVAISYIVTTWSLSYMTGTLGLPSSVPFGLMLVLNVIGVAAVPLGGLASDRWGRKRALGSFMAVSAVGMTLLFPLLQTRNFGLMLLGVVLTQGAQLASVGVLAALYAEPFPVPVRYSGHAAAYTMTNLLAGGTAPFVAAALVAATGTPWSVAFLVLGLYVISFTILARLKETRWSEFRTNFGSVSARASEQSTH